jgi:hypothetical protein
MRALQADPELRYGNALDLQIDLEDFAREARLPVSSARMGRFMRDLFEEEIRKTLAEVQAEQTRVEPHASLPGHTVIAPPNSSPPDGFEIHDLTPSELRNYAEPTPGIVKDDFSGSGTDIAVGPVPGKVRAGRVALVGAGFVLTLGVGASAIVLTGYDPRDEMVEGAASTVPEEIVAPDPPPDPSDREAALAPVRLRTLDEGIDHAAPPEAAPDDAPTDLAADGEAERGAESAGPGDARPAGLEGEEAEGAAEASARDKKDEGEDESETAQPKKPRVRKSTVKKQPPAAPKQKRERAKYDKNSFVPPGMSLDKK